MFITHPEVLEIFLEPLIGLADDDDEVNQYIHINPQTEKDYKLIIRERLIESFEVQNSAKKKLAKFALGYYLSNPDIDFERVFEAILPPFDAPDPARNFFLWIWEELYGTENYNLIEAEGEFIVKK